MYCESEATKAHFPLPTTRRAFRWRLFLQPDAVVGVARRLLNLKAQLKPKAWGGAAQRLNGQKAKKLSSSQHRPLTRWI
ncbi:hypothetical protein CFIMG_004906RAa [Ceratocystis fimbriata CBS 114723]|uniref:Uncharacterized protein n=1 Tax=Ceratocystis fimbriata CBS 114723 TaxID=1035309 RepID=A0A2C5WJK1_9PEZI|nr:hypothetical protein CFIMG_004906RAa [Ceratocystis fimbriata CBS 114723]